MGFGFKFGAISSDSWEYAQWANPSSLPFFLLFLISLCTAIIPSDTSYTLLSSVALQLLCVLVSFLYCVYFPKLELKEYDLAKKAVLTAEASRKLVHRLIPENVLEKLARHHNPREFLGITIPYCSIMFCSLEPQDVLKSRTSLDAFELLDNIFEKFDDAVERHGMHKYQHVADWYIITCPRAARPFDAAEQRKPYPSEYVASLARLANELRDITRTYKVENHQLNLKIGIHCGNAAGAVIGIHRAFYCVYGDTTNTAARMCKYAEPNQILCTEEVVEQVKRVDKDSITFESCGEKSIKGKGIMEVFEIQVADDLERSSGVQHFRRIDSKTRLDLLSKFGIGTMAPDAPTIRKIRDSQLDEFVELLTDPNAEAELLLEQGQDHRNSILRARMVHLIATVGIWIHLTLRPGSTNRSLFYFLLSIHGITIAAYTFILWWKVFRESQIRRKYLLRYSVKKGLISFVLWISRFWFGFRIWVMIIGMGVVTLHLHCSLISFKYGTYMLAVILIMHIPSYYVEESIVNASSLLLAGFSALLATFLESRPLKFRASARMKFYRLIVTEYGRVCEVLTDLMPENIAQQMIRSSIKMPCVMERAVVLQLDICNFTKMSQEIDPLELAGLIHRLFSTFDEAVMQKRLFKVDTIGDAYVVAGWLPCDHDWFIQTKTRKTCSDMLNLASLMIQSILSERKRSKQNLTCRIGISVGIVASGVIGRIQSRFHVMGQTMRDVELLEQTAVCNAVHVSDKFIQGLGYFSSSIAHHSVSNLFHKEPNENHGRRQSASTITERQVQLDRARRNSLTQEDVNIKFGFPLGWKCIGTTEVSNGRFVDPQILVGLKTRVRGKQGLDPCMERTFMLSWSNPEAAQ